MKTNRDFMSRVLIAAFILMSGLALVPYLDLPQTTLGWEQFSGIYESDLDIEPNLGRPGSVFTAVGTNYPPNRLASIYVDGAFVGTVMTDAMGEATFYISTLGANVAIYNVTLEVDANSTATDNFELDENEPLVSAPPAPAGPTFYFAAQKIFLPMIVKN